MRSSKSTGIRAATKIAGALFMIVMAGGLGFAQDGDGDEFDDSAHGGLLVLAAIIYRHAFPTTAGWGWL